MRLIRDKHQGIVSWYDAILKDLATPCWPLYMVSSLKLW